MAILKKKLLLRMLSFRHFLLSFFFTSTIILRKRKSFHGRVVQMHILHNLRVQTLAELQLTVQSVEENISY